MDTVTEIKTSTPEGETPAAALRRLLEGDDRNVTWLAKKTGLSVSHLFRVVQGERPITSRMAEQFADIFGVPVERFLPRVGGGA